MDSKLQLFLQDFRQRSLDWEKQRLHYQQQVTSLETQRKALAEQSELIQVELMVDELIDLEGRRKDLWQSAEPQFRLPLK